MRYDCTFDLNEEVTKKIESAYDVGILNGIEMGLLDIAERLKKSDPEICIQSMLNWDDNGCCLDCVKCVKSHFHSEDDYAPPTIYDT